MSLALLNRNPVTWDSDARTYISAVESADGQSLEPVVARAINTFVIDCKIRGIWGAIKSCCLLCGARTLNGALKPLKGTAPTNNNFVDSAYNRETGLKGNGSNQFVDTNYSSNQSNLNNIHFALYINTINSNSGPDGARTYIADFASNLLRSGTGFGQFRINNTNAITYDISRVNNFMGLVRSEESLITLRFNNTNLILPALSSSSSNISFKLFCRYSGSGVLMREFSDGRISFYSIGESLDLRLLEQCVENYNNSLSRIFTSSYIISDTDAATYIALVEAADKTSLSYSYRKGVNDFIAGCKSDNIWTSLKSSCILIGARTLNGILVPLVGTAPTNFNNGFTASNYNRNLGLSNSSRTGWLYSNRNNNADPQDDQHLSVFVTVPESTATEYQYIGAGAVEIGTSSISTNGNIRSRSQSTATASTPNSNTLAGISRSNNTSIASRRNNTTTNLNLNSQTPFNEIIGVFGRHSAAGITNATLSFYSIGTNLDLALLDNRVTTLINELSAARSL